MYGCNNMHIYAILNMNFEAVALLILSIEELDHLIYQHPICILLYETTKVFAYEGGIAIDTK